MQMAFCLGHSVECRAAIKLKRSNHLPIGLGAMALACKHVLARLDDAVVGADDIAQAALVEFQKIAVCEAHGCLDLGLLGTGINVEDFAEGLVVQDCSVLAVFECFDHDLAIGLAVWSYWLEVFHCLFPCLTLALPGLATPDPTGPGHARPRQTPPHRASPRQTTPYRTAPYRALPSPSLLCRAVP